MVGGTNEYLRQLRDIQEKEKRGEQIDKKEKNRIEKLYNFTMGFSTTRKILYNKIGLAYRVFKSLQQKELDYEKLWGFSDEELRQKTRTSMNKYNTYNDPLYKRLIELESSPKNTRISTSLKSV